jgi:clathrin heavy chain
MANDRVVEATGFLLEVLACNKQEDGPMQTKVLEINIVRAPVVAEAIFQMNQLTYYDHLYIAKLCEKHRMYKRSLENYQDIADIKRVIVNTHVLKKEEIVDFLSKQEPQKVLICIYELMKASRQNVPIVVEVAVNFNEKIPIKEITKMFESFGCFDGMCAFLNNIIATSEDPEVHFKFIEGCVKIGNLREVEKVIRTSKFYDPAKVKDFLKSLKLTDPRPLIYLCDMHQFFEELAEYLFKNNFHQHIETYIKVNVNAAPKVINAILNLSPDETYIRSLTNKIPICNIEELVKAYESHNKLKLLTVWLEARSQEGNETPSVHTALAKIYVETNNDAKNFIMNNQHYDCKEVGAYCETRDHTLAFLAYKKAWGKCDDELIALSNKNNMFRLQARYCVERMDLELWKKVLSEENQFKKSLIEQVIQSALPDTQNAEEVAITVKAFLSAKLHSDLIDLLDKIVLHNPLFAKNAKLQTLLIFTAINADSSKVMDYINRLDVYDGPTLASVCLQQDKHLYEEAFTIYVKMGDSKSATEVLLTNIKDLKRAALFAEKVNEQDVWAKLANAQLTENLVAEAIVSYLKASDSSNYAVVIASAEREQLHENLIEYIQMARTTIREQLLDNTLLFCFAKTGKLSDIEQFITTSHTADITTVADRCYDSKLWEPAKVLYTSIGNNARLASCFVYLKNLPLALDAAKKASSPKTWMEVNYACVKAQEFKLAEIAGTHLVIFPDHLDEVVRVYERYGRPMQLIELLEKCLGMEGEHVGMYTELGVLYAKHDEKKLMSHLTTYYQKLNITKVLTACKKYLLWKEAVFLYAHYEEYDSAITTMIDHSPACWTHELFIDYIKKVKNTDLHFKAIAFYLSEDPEELDGLLTATAAQLDIPKIVGELRKLRCLPLVEKFLLGVQSQDLSVVNDALNEIFLENDDYESMRVTVLQYNNFEQLGLAKKIENHELLEFRRIASLIFRKNKKYGESIDLSIKDLMFKVMN